MDGLLEVRLAIFQNQAQQAEQGGGTCSASTEKYQGPSETQIELQTASRPHSMTRNTRAQLGKAGKAMPLAVKAPFW